MNSHKRIYKLTLSALLIAVAILIPMVSPIKIIVGPMSYTLASHVAIMIAMFISPVIGVAVNLGATLGFLLAGFPLVVVLRAFSQVVWAFLGGYYLVKHPDTLKDLKKMIIFNLGIAVIHGVLEMLVVIPFYYGAGMSMSTLCTMLFGFVGLGTIIHSTVDFIIALIVMKASLNLKSVKEISTVKEVL